MNAKTIVVSTIFISLLIVSVFSMADTLSNVKIGPVVSTSYRPVNINGLSSDTYYNVYILYDPDNKVITYSAARIYLLIRYSYPYVVLKGIQNLGDLEQALHDDPKVAILFFNTTYSSVIISDNEYSWESFGSTLSWFSDIEFVFCLGNTYRLNNFKKPTWHYDEYDYSGITSVEVYAVWETAFIFKTFGEEYSEIASNMERVAVKYYFENLGTIFEDNIEPTIVIGGKDPEISQALIAKYLEQHPNSLHASRVDPSGQGKPILIGMRNVTTEANDDIDFMKIPVLSGLKGPVGDFVDKVLDFLISYASDTLTIDMSFINEFVEAFSAITELIGDPSKLGEGSLLKSFLNILKNEFPFIANYSVYFELFVDGFYALKGDLSSIIDFMTSAINLVVPSVGEKIDEIKDILTNILSIGEEVLDMVGSITDNKISLILNWIVSKLSNLTIQRLLQEIPGIPDITPILENITSIIKLAYDMLSISNVTDFVDKLYDVLVNKLKLVTGTEIIGAMNKVKEAIKLVLTFASKYEANIGELLSSLITTFIDTSYISDLSGMIDEILDEIDEAIKEAKTDINQFINTILNILSSHITSANEEINKAKNILVKIITLITAISNIGFDIKDADGLFSIINDIIDEFLDIPTDTKEKLFLVINATIIPFGKIASSSRIQEALFKAVDFLKDPKQELLTLLIDVAKMIIENVYPSINIESILSKIEDGMKIVNGILSALGEVKDRPFDGIFTALMIAASYAPVELFGEISIGNLTKILEVLIPDLMGLAKVPSPEEAIGIVLTALGALNSTIKDTVENILTFLLEIREVLRNGVKWLTNKIVDWVVGKISEFVSDLIKDLEDLINSFAFLELSGDMNLGLGGLDLLTFGYMIAIRANLDIDENGLIKDLKDVVLKGKFIDLLNPIETFWTLIKRISITPIFEAGFSLKSIFSDDNKMMQTIIESLGVSVEIEGEARFKLQLFSFKSGSFDVSQFMDLLEWYLKFRLETSKTFTIFDLIGASTLGSIAEKVGLDGISVTLSLGFALEINIGSSSEEGGDQSTLSVEITIAGCLHIGFDIAIAEVSLDFTLTILFRFTFDITRPANPIVFTVEVSYNLKIHLEFLFVGDTYTFGGTIYSYTFPQPGETPEDKASGFDKDGDGLPDKFEMVSFGFSPDREDTDGDGLTDNVELNGFGTDPLDPDTDGDGLSDYEEIYETKTNPFLVDSDSDRLSDYLEARVYGTNPNEIDTDGDGLDDHFEVTYTWDISSVTISITGVMIGGTIYYDHTDPLNPDTDGDGLLDGQEGPMGGYYGDVLYSFGSNPIIFNNGYTHPLDNDTDDDSYVQLSDGSIYEPVTFLRSMTDKEEIDGITVVFIEDGEPVLKTFRTSPVCPDTDQDTSSGAAILNSDGYELALNPPTDPLDGDSDDDGIIDGDEGVLSPFSNKTDPLNPDTDGDNLGDLQEVLLGLDPTNPDSDYDLVPDGEEFLKYGTNPRLYDSDMDGLSDGEELYYWHCNPMLKDSDADGLRDGEEVLIYFTDPMDEDTDNDNLTDLEEVMFYGTNPFETDSDYDGIIDGEEVKIYDTNPLDWDSDDDSIIYPNEYGQMTWPMSDGMEVFTYGTDPLISDTDSDGISDALELYLASGIIPNFEPIPLDPLNNDTDSDGLIDGAELRIENVSDIVYPYVSFNMTYPHGSSPVSNDTDGDGLSDYEEIYNYTTMPFSNDSDGDGLADYDEVVIYNTSPIHWDTDYDNISDYDEIFGYNTTESLVVSKNPRIRTQAIYTTDPTDPDTDDDLLPDGYELMVTHTDPTKSDTDGDGIPDGEEFDTDEDGLTDGEEFFVYGTAYYPHGGPFNPDSDQDGISDGTEVHLYGTDPANPDTDGDGFPDGAEIAVGTDPKSPTTQSEYLDALNKMLGGKQIAVLTPVGQIIDKFVDVRVINGTTFKTMWFRYIKDGVYSENYTLVYDNVTRQWVYSDIVWEPGQYTLEVFGELPDGTVLSTTVTFEYLVPPSVNPYFWLAIGIAVGFAVALVIIVILPKVMERRKGKGVKVKEGEKSE